MLINKTRFPFLAVVLLLAGCATQTESPDLTTAVPTAANAQWTFSAHTTWGNPARISISINNTPLTSVSEVSPGNIIGAYQGHAIHAQCTTQWPEGAPYGTGSCYVYVDGAQTAILIL
jgi:hypothetical protein